MLLNRELPDEILQKKEEAVIWYLPVEGQEGITYSIAYINDLAAVLCQQEAWELKGLTNFLFPPENTSSESVNELIKNKPGNNTLLFEYKRTIRDKLYRVLLEAKEEGILQVIQEMMPQGNRETVVPHDQRYEQLLEMSNEGVLLLEPLRDDKGIIIDFKLGHANQAGLKLSRFNKEDIGKPLSHLIPNLRHSDQLVLYKQVWETGESIQSDRAFIDQSGHPFGWFRVLLTKEGNDVVSRFTDITEKKQNEQLIQQQSDLVRSILDASINGIVVAEAVRDEKGTIKDFKYVKVNDNFCRMIKRRAEELEDHCMLSVFPGMKEAGVFEAYEKVVNTGQQFRMETHYQSEGIHGWYDLSAVKMGTDGLVVTIGDISEQKKNREALQRSESQLKSILEAQQSRVLLLTPVFDSSGEIINFRYKMLNKAAKCGLPEHLRDAEDKLVTDIFPDYKETTRYYFHKQAYLTDEPQHYQFHYTTNGMNAWFDSLVTKIGEDILVYQHDLTESKLMQFKLENFVDELKRSNSNLEEFAYVASHDLQEPLRKIHTFSDKLKQELTGQLSETQQRMFDRMENATQRMRQLIEDLLIYSNVSQKKRLVEKVQLNQLLSEVLTDLETVAEEKKAIISIPSLPTLEGDRLQLRQLFQNILSNALKYSGQDVRPQIKISYDIVSGLTCRELAGNGDPNRSYHLIRVSDNGIGFEQSEAQKIFQVFHRLHGRSEYEGTGVGLAIVQRVINNHNGFVTAQSEPGKGSTFNLFFPMP